MIVYCNIDSNDILANNISQWVSSSVKTNASIENKNTKKNIVKS